MPDSGGCSVEKVKKREREREAIDLTPENLQREDRKAFI